jgi:hypothetical protein
MESTFVMDFTKQEELERKEKEMAELQKEAEKIENINKNLEERLAAANIPSSSSGSKNVVSNKGSQLKDDRGTDAEQLYKEHKRVQDALKKNQKKQLDDEFVDNDVESPDDEEAEEETSYVGDAVLSYTLDGRTGRYLPNPVYKCYRGGEVSVTIYVNRDGQVKKAVVNKDISVSDDCLHKQALEAACQSRFSRSSTAPAEQVGEIVYLFQNQ